MAIDTPPGGGDNGPMAKASKPPAIKLICGMISADAARFDAAADALAQAFGPVERTSEVMDFDFTHYYDAEMGAPLRRRFVSFAGPHSPEMLAEAKVRTNAIERQFAEELAGRGPARPVNLDVGYVESSKLVLASMKNFSHRLYLRGGVYAEVTLMVRRGLWEPLAWTFPDYRSGRYDAFLTAVRDTLGAAAAPVDASEAGA